MDLSELQSVWMSAASDKSKEPAFILVGVVELLRSLLALYHKPLEEYTREQLLTWIGCSREDDRARVCGVLEALVDAGYLSKSADGGDERYGATEQLTVAVELRGAIRRKRGRDDELDFIAVSGLSETDRTVLNMPMPAKLACDELRHKWREWVEYRRREVRAPLTVRSARLQLKAMAEKCSSASEAIAAIETSMANGWRGVFFREGAKHKSYEWIGGRPRPEEMDDYDIASLTPEQQQAALAFGIKVRDGRVIGPDGKQVDRDFVSSDTPELEAIREYRRLTRERRRDVVAKQKSKNPDEHEQ